MAKQTSINRRPYGPLNLILNYDLLIMIIIIIYIKTKINNNNIYIYIYIMYYHTIVIYLSDKREYYKKN